MMDDKLTMRGLFEYANKQWHIQKTVSVSIQEESIEQSLHHSSLGRAPGDSRASEQEATDVKEKGSGVQVIPSNNSQ